MPINYTIPKAAQWQQTANSFTATFNNPTLGVYDFNTAANVDRFVLALQQNRIYLIARLSIGGNIPQEEFLGNIATVPLLRLKFVKESQRIYPLPIPIMQYYDGLESLAWFWSDKAGEQLVASLNVGVLNQDAFLIGYSEIKLNVTMNIFEISDNGFVQDFKKSDVKTTIGKQNQVRSSNLVFVD